MATYWRAIPFWWDWEEPGRREVWVCAFREGSGSIKFLPVGLALRAGSAASGKRGLLGEPSASLRFHSAFGLVLRTLSLAGP